MSPIKTALPVHACMRRAMGGAAASTHLVVTTHGAAEYCGKVAQRVLKKQPSGVSRRPCSHVSKPVDSTVSTSANAAGPTRPYYSIYRSISEATGGLLARWMPRRRCGSTCHACAGRLPLQLRQREAPRYGPSSLPGGSWHRRCRSPALLNHLRSWAERAQLCYCICGRGLAPGQLAHMNGERTAKKGAQNTLSPTGKQ